MRKLVLYSFMCFLAISVSELHAQYLIVQDKDGYVNVREKPSAGSRITGRLNDQELVASFRDGENGWEFVSYWKNGVEETGYIHASRLKPLDSIPGLRTLRQMSRTARQSVYQFDSIKVIITIKPFVAKEHRLTYNKESKEYIAQIDGSGYWGKDGDMPATEYKSIEISWGHSRFSLPASALKGMFEPEDGSADIYVDRGKQRLYISASNSDGAGCYEVMWVWEKGEVKNRLIFVP